MTRLAPSCATRSCVGRHRSELRVRRAGRPGPIGVLRHVYAHGMRVRRRFHILSNYDAARTGAPAGLTPRSRARETPQPRVGPGRGPGAGRGHMIAHRRRHTCARRDVLHASVKRDPSHSTRHAPARASRGSGDVRNERDHVWHITHAVAVKTPIHSLGDVARTGGRYNI